MWYRTSNTQPIRHRSEQPDTIGQRTALYFIMLALSVAAMVAAAVLRKPLADRLGGWNAALIAAGSYLVAVIVVACILPGINEVPDTFPAVVLWQFRVASFGMQLLMWATIGLLFGALTERAVILRGQLPAGSRLQATLH